ncbi:MAG: Ferredoxin--nitrite reductase, partial [Prosthecobacter sp.]|nr:Ferredoxin--nitrite reductase [Prosthecobacter sp.]
MPAMSIEPPPVASPMNADFSGEQKRYLEGFFAGVAAGGVSFGDMAPAPAPALAGPTLDDLTKEERIKRELHPFDAIEQLV